MHKLTRDFVHHEQKQRGEAAFSSKRPPQKHHLNVVVFHVVGHPQTKYHTGRVEDNDCLSAQSITQKEQHETGKGVYHQADELPSLPNDLLVAVELLVFGPPVVGKRNLKMLLLFTSILLGALHKGPRLVFEPGITLNLLASKNRLAGEETETEGHKSCRKQT